MAPGRTQSAFQKRAAFFDSIRKEKGDTIRWSLRHGGLTLLTRDDGSLTPLMHAAMMGKMRSLNYLLEATHGLRSKQDRAEVFECADDQGRTAMHWAAAKGYANVVEVLKEEWPATLLIKDNRGNTPRDVAQASGHKSVVEEIDRVDDDDDDDDDDEVEEGFEGETSTQRSKRKKRELMEKERRGAAAPTAAQKQQPEAEDAAKPADDADASEPAHEPVTADVRAALDGGKREVTLANVGTGDDGVPAREVDPALWRCKNINMLTLRSDAGLDGMRLAGVSRLVALLTLDVSSCGLSVLPDAIGSLALLKNLSCEGNALDALPASVAKLEKLESVNIRRNAISDLSPLVACKELSVLNASGNKVAALPENFFANKGRLTVLNIADNVLDEIDAEIEKVAASLTALNVKGNQLEFAPAEVANLKKLKELEMGDNPWKEPKLKKVTAGEGSKVKDILNIVSKTSARGGGGKGGKGKKGKKGKGGGGESDDDDDE